MNSIIRAWNWVTATALRDSLLLLLVLALWPAHSEAGIPPATNNAAAPAKCVRMIYLASHDREVKTEYRAAIEKAIKHVREWYGAQLNGPTFKLHEPVVEIVQSDKTAEWFTKNPNGDHPDNWGYNNAYAEARRLIGTRQNDSNFVWVLYSDGPGNKGRAGNSVAYLPEDDLLGLIGKHPTQKDPLRWIGGLAHELGHAFGLPHPSDTVRDADAIMWAGFYGKYPKGAYFTALDKAILLSSPFFFGGSGKPVAAARLFNEEYAYQGGYFGRIGTNVPVVWTEGKTESAQTHYFEEISRNDREIIIRDPGRGFRIRIPRTGGLTSLSPDDGASWRPLYEVKRAR